MTRIEIRDELVQALHEIKLSDWHVEPTPDGDATDLVLHTPCYVAFFAVVEGKHFIADAYNAAEKETLGTRDRIGRTWPRDLNLVMLLETNAESDPEVTRRIVDNRHHCRKFVLSLNRRQVSKVLTDLPFLPPPIELGGDTDQVRASVRETLRGYDMSLIDDLANYSPGATAIVNGIIEGKYHLNRESPTEEATGRSRLVQPRRKRLVSLDITDFRGIRRLTKDKMPLTGDVVLIYGPNGVGKTSIAESIEWVLTGQVYRLRSAQSGVLWHHADPIMNVFTSKKSVRVTCQLSNGVEVTREIRGEQEESTVNGKTMSDYRGVIDYVAGSTAHSEEGRLETGQLRDLFRGSHMLGQHNIREFLEKDTASTRFDILTNMIGAEAFVRFRKKVATVKRNLNSVFLSKEEQIESLNRDLEHQRTQRDQRKEDLKTLSESITSGQEVGVLIAEIVDLLQKSDCSVDEASFYQTAAEWTSKKLDFVTATVETAIRSKRAADSDLEVRLRSLELDWKGYAEAHSRCRELRSEIEDARDTAEKGRTRLREQEAKRRSHQDHVNNLQRQLSDAIEKHRNLTWMKENLPSFTKHRDELRSKQEFLAGARERTRSAEDEIERLRRECDSKKARMEAAEQEVNKRRSKRQSLESLISRVSKAQELQEEIQERQTTEEQLRTQINEYRQQQSSVKVELNSVREQLTELQSLYDSEANRHEELSTVLARLSAIVRAAECPLCGRDFASLDEAKKTIEQHLTALPRQLKDIAHRLETTKSSVQKKQNDFNLIQEKIRARESELNELRMKSSAASNVVNQFISDCSAMEVTVPSNEPSAWRDKITEARSKIDVETPSLEIADLKEHTTGLQQQIEGLANILDSQRRKVHEIQGECDELGRAVQKLRAEMIERHCDPESADDSASLQEELSTSEVAVRDHKSLISESETALEAAESEVKGLKESISTADEAAATKENQLRQFEATCNRYTTACDIDGIDPHNAHASIEAAKLRIAKIGGFLAAINDKNLILQKVSSLKRIQSEIDDLDNDIDSATRQLEDHSREESHLSEWVQCCSRLEDDVVKKQVDIVGSHLETLEPTTQLLYRRLNPHPVFGNLKMRVDENDRELDFTAESSLPLEQLRDMAVPPSNYFSDAQMNSLAITVFLAGALRQRWSGFRTILIDDPIQQMDELNVYAFIDLIRGLSCEHQFIIFTCSRDFYLLGLERFACLNKARSDKFLAYRLEGIAPAELKVHCDSK